MSDYISRLVQEVVNKTKGDSGVYYIVDQGLLFAPIMSLVILSFILIHSMYRYSKYLVCLKLYFVFSST